MLQVIVVHVGFKSELVLQSNSVSGNQIEAVNLGKEILLAKLGVLLVSLVNMDPDQTCKVV